MDDGFKQTLEKKFMKWLNAALNKETLSSEHLKSLRLAAIDLILNPEIQTCLGKLTVHVEKELIQIRQARKFHLDHQLQKSMLDLLFKFDPLWLRIGLEAVFGETISLRGNHEIQSFIKNKLFRDRNLESRHPDIRSDEHSDCMKKHLLKKFISLLYFLDVAKHEKIIKHDPCLFLKTSDCKETNDILLQFSSSRLGNIVGIKRDLERIGIVLNHKQTFIDELT